MNTRLYYGICSACIFLFVYAGISKLLQLNKFAEQLQNSPVTTTTPFLFAVAIPLTEIGIAVLLCFERWRQYALYGFIALMSVFTVYIAGMLLFAIKLPCSCGGVISTMSWKTHLIFNCLFIAAAVLAVKWNRSSTTIAIQSG